MRSESVTTPVEAMRAGEWRLGVDSGDWQQHIRLRFWTSLRSRVWPWGTEEGRWAEQG